jgi:transposase
MDLGPDLQPRAIGADKGYDSAANRKTARRRAALLVIPHRQNTETIPAFLAKALYRGRARIEQAVGKLKRCKRIALRREKTARNFGSFLALAATLISVKSVQTA